MTAREYSQSAAGGARFHPANRIATAIWLALVSAAFALAVTAVLFDRTTLAGMTALWLSSFGLLFCLSLLWWANPRLDSGGVRFSRYESVSLLLVTLPLLVAAIALVAVVYQSDEIHNELYHHFYYRQLFRGSEFSVLLLAAALYGSCLSWLARDVLQRIGAGYRPRDALGSALASLNSLPLLGTLAIAILLATVSVSMMNVNFWRFWATADGWASVGHYPFTLTDALHARDGGVSPFFVSFPLLPLMLTASFNLLGHNTLAAHLPLIVASVSLPLALFLLVREITGNGLLAFLFACVTASFPLLRAYTLNVAEADALFITMLLLAAYFQIRSGRAGSGPWTNVVAGVCAGLATLARPEGILYMIAMHLTMLPTRWRSGGFWLSTLIWGLFVAAFSAVSMREFDMVWPGNHSGSIRISNFGQTLTVVRESGILELWAGALSVSEGVLALMALAALSGVVLASVRMLRTDFGLIFMPVAALGNIVMVFSVGPIAAEAAKYHDFFRHISYGIPFLAVTLAYGINALCESAHGWWSQWSRATVYVLLAAAVMAQLYLLSGPVDPLNTRGSPAMTSDVHVTAAELVMRPYPLPVMRFQQIGTRYVPDSEDYMRVFPGDVHEFYAAADVRSSDDAIEYFRAAGLLFVGFLALIGISLTAQRWIGDRRLGGRVADRVYGARGSLRGDNW